MNLETAKTCKIINEISSELSMYNGYLRDSLMTKFINERLAETLHTYSIGLDNNISYLAKTSAIRVMKAIAKKKKQTDKEIIESYMEDYT